MGNNLDSSINFWVAQVLDLVVDVVEQDAGVQFVLLVVHERQLVLLPRLVLREGYLFSEVVDAGVHHVALGKFDGFDGVVVLRLGVRPAASVGAHHVCAVADGAEAEGVVFGFDDLAVAEPQGQPVAGGLLDEEAEGFVGGFGQAGLHDGEFVA